MATGDFGSFLATFVQSCVDDSEVVLQSHTAAAGDVDANTGLPIDPDAPALINPETGDIYCLDKASAFLSSEAGTTDNGVAYEADTVVIDIPGYGEICIPHKAEDPFFGPGEKLPEGAPDIELPDGTTIGAGDPVPDTVDYITYYADSGEIYCNAKPEDIIKTEGEVIPAGTIITDDSVDAALLDASGALIADYTVQAGESFIFDGDEACGKAPGPMLCSGEPIEGPYKPLTVEQGHAPVLFADIPGLGATDDCKPPAPNCPELIGQRTFTQNDYGTIEWMWTGADWVDVNFSPWFDQLPYQGANSPQASDTNGLLASAVASEIVVGTPISRTITNDDCYCWGYRSEVRTLFSWTGWGNDNQFVASLQAGANDTTPGSWVTTAGDSILDSTQWDASSVVSYDKFDYMYAFNVGKIQPGQTVVFEHQVSLNGTQYTDTNLQNQRMTASSLGGRIELYRCPC